MHTRRHGYNIPSDNIRYPTERYHENINRAVKDGKFIADCVSLRVASVYKTATIKKRPLASLPVAGAICVIVAVIVYRLKKKQNREDNPASSCRYVSYCRLVKDSRLEEAQRSQHIAILCSVVPLHFRLITRKSDRTKRRSLSVVKTDNSRGEARLFIKNIYSLSCMGAHESNIFLRKLRVTVTVVFT